MHYAKAIQISLDQTPPRIIEWRRFQLGHRHLDQHIWRVTEQRHMIEQSQLASLKCFDQKHQPQLLQISISLFTKGLFKRQSLGETVIDLVGIHMLVEHDIYSPAPGEASDGPANIVCH